MLDDFFSVYGEGVELVSTDKDIGLSVELIAVGGSVPLPPSLLYLEKNSN